MQIPLINAGANNKIAASAFYGLNRTEKGRNGEFLDMENMSSLRYPCLSPRKPRAEAVTQDNIRAVIAPKYEENINEITAFTGVLAEGGKLKFYYNDENKDFEDGAKIPDTCSVTLCDFNGKIIICAYDTKKDKSYMYYYDYTATETGKVCNMETGIDGETGFAAGSEGDPETDAEVDNYIRKVNFKWSDYFGIGDSITLSGFADDKNNTVSLDSKFQTADKTRPISCIVTEVDDANGRLHFQMYNYAHERLVLSDNKDISDDGLTIRKPIPTMNHICVHNNRLWGTNPNGEYIYASKLGDCMNFMSFQGLANDSYYAEIGTKGGFVGIVSYRDNLVAFKRDYIHHVYGDKPANFTIPKQLQDCGCIDIKSAVEVNSVLYFLGYNGFYAYTGGQPAIISEPLDMTYLSAAAMTDGIRYIASAKRRDNGKYELLAYDPRYGLWHKEDEFKAIGHFRWHNDLYMADGNQVWRCGAALGDKVTWSAESVMLHESLFDDKGVSEIWIRARIDEGAYITVHTSVNGGAWTEHSTLEPQGLKVYRVPVRFKKDEYFQYKLEGEGQAVIHDIEYIAYVGGRPYKITVQGG